MSMKLQKYPTPTEDIQEILQDSSAKLKTKGIFLAAAITS